MAHIDPLTIIGTVSLAIGSILTIFSRIPKETINNQKDLIASYEKRFADIELQRETDRKAHDLERMENAKAIADLQGQIKVYKELPLQEMATAMQAISDVNKTIAASNKEILKTLKASSKIAAEDRFGLNNPSQHINEQVVDTQIIGDKK